MSDPRCLFANARVADADLRGQIEAPRFARPEMRIITAPVTDLYRSDESTALERQLLYGEAIRVLEDLGTRSFVQSVQSGYVGYVPRAQTGAWQESDYVVQVARSLAFASADLKSPAPVPLSLGSRLKITGRSGRFAKADGIGFVPDTHLRALERTERDPVSVAERLIGTPYLWGGNSAFGIDCSGLVQIALNACGHDCPGDSDQQMAELGCPLESGSAPARGDLMFWTGHVAWVMDENTLIHANAGAMAVAREPLDAAIARIEAQGGGAVLAHKRLTL